MIFGRFDRRSSFAFIFVTYGRIRWLLPLVCQVWPDCGPHVAQVWPMQHWRLFKTAGLDGRARGIRPQPPHQRTVFGRGWNREL